MANKSLDVAVVVVILLVLANRRDLLVMMERGESKKEVIKEEKGGTMLACRIGFFVTIGPQPYVSRSYRRGQGNTIYEYRYIIIIIIMIILHPHGRGDGIADREIIKETVAGFSFAETPTIACDDTKNENSKTTTITTSQYHNIITTMMAATRINNSLLVFVSCAILSLVVAWIPCGPCSSRGAFSSHQRLFRGLLLPTLPSSSTSTSRFLRPVSSFSSKSSTKDEPREQKAFPQQTPHSGRHFRPSHPAYNNNQYSVFFQRLLFPRRRRRRRFMEGWYYRLTLPDTNDTDNNKNNNKKKKVSFALIVSIEDPGNNRSKLKLACIQVVGPDDGYLVQAQRDDSAFWAWKHQQGLGCVFELHQLQQSTVTNNDDNDNTIEASSIKTVTTVRSPDEFYHQVKSGFQCLPTHFLGRIRGHDGSLGGVLEGQGIPGSCDFDFHITPICGWGDYNTNATTNNNNSGSEQQKSTGGWLADYAVFEPHWQVTLADARASGTVTWNNHTYTFENAPFYAEKNWGAALPSKWYWTQCNSFDGYSQLSVTAGGGIRKIPFGRQESLGMVSIHYNGTFYEGTPWTGNMEWKVATWGSWELKGYGTGQHPFEAIVKYECDPVKTPGLVFRAPTPDQGMVPFCRDTFEAKCSLTLWELEWNAQERKYVRKPGPPLIDHATSSQGGAEVGGGPWWDEWAGESKLKQPIRGLLRFPFRMANLRRRLFRRNR